MTCRPCTFVFGGRKHATFTIGQTEAKTVTGDDTTAAASHQIIAAIEFEPTQHLQEQVDENPFLELHEPENSENSVETPKDSEGMQADATTIEHHAELS